MTSKTSSNSVASAPSRSESSDFTNEIFLPSIDLSSSSSLRRKSDAVENEVSSKILVSSEIRNRKNLIRKSTADMTINKLHISALGLIGRDDEMKLLDECFDQVASSAFTTTTPTTTDRVSRIRTKKLLLIKGSSGTGKSALALTIRNKVERSSGAFVVGKFDYCRSEPFTGISAFCREICGKLLTEPDEIQTVVADKIVEDLGTELLSVLIAAVPDLEDLVQRSSDNDTSNIQYKREKDNQLTIGTISRQKSNHAFRLYIRIICSHYRPLVVVLDDLQWAQEVDIEVMEVLITDKDNFGLFIIGCYRPEIQESHALTVCLRDLKERLDDGTDYSINEMEIGPLSVEQVNQAIMKLLSIDPDRDEDSRAYELATICHKRTQGNPFFLISFLNLLYSEEYLQFNLGTLKWTWETDRIVEETASAENVVEMMMKEMNNVNQDLGSLLQIASLLGTRFESKTLFLVWNKLNPIGDDCETYDKSKLMNHLEQAVDQSFIEAIEPNGFCWVHDKVQEAALSMVPYSAQSTFKFDVGMILLRNLDSEDIDPLLFSIVSLLDSKECLDDDMNVEIAKLCAKAAGKARDLSAFHTAAKYATIGIQHLTGHDKWEGHYYDLTLELYRVTAESMIVLGRPEKEIHGYADEVLDNGRCILDKAPVYYVLAVAKGKLEKFSDACTLCLDAIDQLDVVKIPRNGLVLAARAISGLLSTKKLLAATEADNLPFMSEQRQTTTMKLLDLLASYSYQAKNVNLLLFATIQMIRLTIKYGISSSAPSAIAMYGGLAFGVLNDLKAGVHIAQLSFATTNRLKGQANEALVIARTFGFTLAYSRPSHEAIKQFLHGYSEGMKFGDTEMSSWCLFNHAACSFFVGKQLKTIEEDCRIYVPYMQNLGISVPSEATSFVLMAVQYLMDKDEECWRDLFKDVKGEPKFSELTGFMCRSAAYTYSAKYEEGAKYALEVGNALQKAAPGHQILLSEIFTRGVCLYAMACKTNKRKYKKPARAIRKIVVNWIQQGAVNSSHQRCLLDAEEAAIRGHITEASKLYREGIVEAGRRGFLRDFALINERYASFLLDRGDDYQAAHHAKESLKGYEEWGAARTVAWLRSKYSLLLPDDVPQSVGLVDPNPSSLSLGT